MRQFGSLQTVPEDTAWTRFEHTWREDQTSVDCQSDIQQGSTPYGAPSTSSIAIQAKLTSLRSERDRLRWEVAEKDEQLIDQCQLQRELQRELAQACAELQRRDQELARAIPWRGPRGGPMEVPTHLRIDTSTRLSPRIGVFRGNAHLCPERDGRST
ncbi:hypothetical protein CRG98_041713 [Punica granatum]|uniref:Uncharacterized protein n=1 Tax=Punica granatum TaxID=22663 RepID=A0A2I0I1N6_PUNGR|nr:hypothetical protein CRG98_041713 [Punica granatum]